MNLLNALRTLGKNLLSGYPCDEDKMLKGLNNTLIQLRIARSKYLKRKLPVPETGELLEEAFNLYIEGVQNIVSSIKDNDKDILSLGLFKVEEADDILGSIEDVITQNKELLKDISLS